MHMWQSRGHLDSIFQHDIENPGTEKPHSRNPDCEVPKLDTRLRDSKSSKKAASPECCCSRPARLRCSSTRADQRQIAKFPKLLCACLLDWRRLRASKKRRSSSCRTQCFGCHATGMQSARGQDVDWIAQTLQISVRSSCDPQALPLTDLPFL